ncbi:ABC transporter ATP-binding protein [Paenibacillus sp. NEAU-GSW1]|uniref:ABC transporter ATP-binding protein n=1 Tax=Paenibacillus sp. NEAU-GSW1 TaxID=2682486 RepID=UPI0012E0EFED|nr:ABC transporter ATP-binding protein [Paenibacillus sp. NEAU-GSW1]MUT67025.1 ATP-binding cassette domain-containing protein [Paenibacillus sp. NEAU-GSW1]
MIEAKALSKKLPNGKPVIKHLSFAFQEGRFYGIIGPNGAGKSTLLQLLSGAAHPSEGIVLFEGQNIAKYPAKQLARRLAMLQQGGLPPVAFTVRETVGMGRFPYQNWFGDETRDPSELIDSALAAMGLAELANRPLDRLSGGERQRAALAKVMVQEADMLLLDEPTTFLDIGYQVQLLDTVRSWQRQQGMTVIAVLHDLNLAALYCDELLVLHDGVIADAGAPEKVLNEQLIRRVYGANTSIVYHPVTGMPQFLLQPSVNV